LDVISSSEFSNGAAVNAPTFEPLVRGIAD